MTALDAMRKAVELLNQVTTLEQEDEDALFDAITNLRAAIAEMELAEPVAWVNADESSLAFTPSRGGNWQPLYTHPAAPSQEVERLKEELAVQIRGNQVMFENYELKVIQLEQEIERLKNK